MVISWTLWTQQKAIRQKSAFYNFPNKTLILFKQGLILTHGLNTARRFEFEILSVTKGALPERQLISHSQQHLVTTGLVCGVYAPAFRHKLFAYLCLLLAACHVAKDISLLFFTKHKQWPRSSLCPLPATSPVP